MRARVAAIAAVGLAIHIGLGVLYAQLVAPDHQVRVQDDLFLNRTGAQRVLVAGGSHPRMAIPVKQTRFLVNTATRGEHYIATRYRLAWLLDRAPQGIETVLLDYDAASFSGYRSDDFRPEYVWGRYVPFSALGRESGRPLLYAGLWGKAHLAPYVGEAEMVAQWVTRDQQFRRPGDPMRPRFESAPTAAEVAQRHFPAPDNAWDPRQAQALRDLIGLLRARDLRVVLVSYPMRPDYLAQIEARGVQPSRRAALLEELIEPGVVDHLDYERLYAGPKLFLDPHHLSIGGAKKFVRVLARDLQRLGVWGQRGADGR